MRFKHSLSIFGTNLSLTYKVLILIFIVGIIASALLVSIFNPLITGIKDEIAYEGMDLSISDILENPVENISQIWNITSNFLYNNTTLIVTRLLFIFALVVLTRFFIALSHIPITKIIHSKMATGYSNGLFANFVATLPQTFMFALISSLIYALLDILIFTFCFYIFLAMFKIMTISAFLIFFALFIALLSARITLFSQWLAVISDGQRNVFKALVTGVKQSLKCFFSHYIMVLTVVIGYFSIIMATTIPTFGLLPIITFPMFIVMLCILNLTSYFNTMNRKYYTDDGVTVFNPEK